MLHHKIYSDVRGCEVVTGSNGGIGGGVGVGGGVANKLNINAQEFTMSPSAEAHNNR